MTKKLVDFFKSYITPGFIIFLLLLFIYKNYLSGVNILSKKFFFFYYTLLINNFLIIFDFFVGFFINFNQHKNVDELIYQFFSYKTNFKFFFYSINFKILYILKNLIQYNTLPIFFYFYILFILTTLFSLFYLSFLGLYGVFILNLISIVLFWCSSILSFDSFFLHNTCVIINFGKWFMFDINQYATFEFIIDPISYSFFFLTLTISVFVYAFTFSYFRYEPNIERFMLLLNSFVISMICLVLSGNCFVLFLG